jgi:hypothetical protein
MRSKSHSGGLNNVVVFKVARSQVESLAPAAMLHKPVVAILLCSTPC